MHIVFGIPGFSTDSTSAEGKLVRAAVSKCASKVGSSEFRPGAVVFTIDRAFGTRGSDRMNAAALRIMMECLIELDSIWLAFHSSTPRLYESGVYYRRTLLWDTIPCLLARGWGDCKSLAAMRVAENHRDGIWSRSVYRFLPGNTSTMYHILVMYGEAGFYSGIGASADGQWEDPSKALGMEVMAENPDSAAARVHYGSEGVQ